MGGGKGQEKTKRSRGGNKYIKMGKGERSAITVYQSTIPCCVTHVAEKPGARTRPHCAPASFEMCSWRRVSSMLWVAVPAMSG